MLDSAIGQKTLQFLAKKFASPVTSQGLALPSHAVCRCCEKVDETCGGLRLGLQKLLSGQLGLVVGDRQYIAGIIP